MKTNVLEEIAAERARQISKGFDAMHDVAESMDLPTLAIGVVLDVDADLMANDEETEDRIAHIRSKHPDRRCRMVIAAALLVAEIERLDRLTSQDIDPDHGGKVAVSFKASDLVVTSEKPSASIFDHATQTWKPMDIESTTDPDSEQQDGE